jgi:hypothetical protein
VKEWRVTLVRGHQGILRPAVVLEDGPGLTRSFYGTLSPDPTAAGTGAVQNQNHDHLGPDDLEVVQLLRTKSRATS